MTSKFRTVGIKLLFGWARQKNVRVEGGKIILPLVDGVLGIHIRIFSNEGNLDKALFDEDLDAEQFKLVEKPGISIS